MSAAPTGNANANGDPGAGYCRPGERLSPAHLKLIVDAGITPEISRERGHRTVDMLFDSDDGEPISNFRQTANVVGDSSFY